MKLKSILLAVIAASAQLAHAGLTTIEPDDYAAGAEITFPGVTLQALVSPGAIVDPVRSVESGAALASTGVRSFGEFNRAAVCRLLRQSDFLLCDRSGQQ